MKIRYILILLVFLGIIGIFVADKFLWQDTSKNVKDKDKISDQNIPNISRPEDFLQKKRDIQRGVFYDFENLTKDYYLQPDFYPSYTINSPHDYTRWGVHGYGAFPGEISYNINNFKKGQYIDLYTFIKTGDDIETFQGMKFAIDIINNMTYKNPNQNFSGQNFNDLFDVYISPNTVMFTPTFPVRSEYSIDNRTYDWAYKLKITIVAKSEIHTGSYEFKLKALPPEEDIQKLYYSDIQKINQTQYKCPKSECDENIVELRKKVYVNGGQFQADKFFNIIINVGNG
jgi:hypothetical protein